jgi:nucleotide-binding universal stress UspA family protein
VVSVVQAASGMPETGAARRTGAEAAVAAAREKLQKSGRPVSSDVLSGSPARAILETASEWGADVIVIGSRGLGAVRGLLVGSVSSAVARAATGSVLVVKGSVTRPLRALMAVDGSADARQAAERLAKLGCPGNAVTVARVIEPMHVGSLGVLPRSVAGPIRAEMERAKLEMHAEAKRDVHAVAEVFRGAGWTAKELLRPGVPCVELVALARRLGAQLVGVGPRGITGLERLLLGSVTERLLSVHGISVFIGR